MRYVSQNVIVTAMTEIEAHSKVSERIQPLLEEGASKGWRLHTVETISMNNTNGANVILIWETD